MDRAGNLYIVDTENHAIRFIDHASGTIRTLAGTGEAGGQGDGGPAARARLDRPHGVAVGIDGRSGSATPITTGSAWSSPAP